MAVNELWVSEQIVAVEVTKDVVYMVAGRSAWVQVVQLVVVEDASVVGAEATVSSPPVPACAVFAVEAVAAVCVAVVLSPAAVPTWVSVSVVSGAA